MKSNEPIAHVSEDGRVHSLREHLPYYTPPLGKGRLGGVVQRVAAEFAGEFGCGEWGKMAGDGHEEIR